MAVLKAGKLFKEDSAVWRVAAQTNRSIKI
jgi:hypothetical protein